MLCLQCDCKRISGKKNFEQLKAATNFSLLKEEDIKREIDNLDETHGPDVLPNEEPFDSEEGNADAQLIWSNNSMVFPLETLWSSCCLLKVSLPRLVHSQISDCM